MDFEKIIKYSGFILTVVSLAVGIDYFLHDIWTSLAIMAVLAVFFFLIYLKQKTPDDLISLKVLNHEVKIDILDPTGSNALHSRKTKFLALKDRVTTFTDHMSADGELLNPRVTPGLIEEIRKEGGDLFVKTTFGKVLKKGDIVDKEITATLKNSFTNNPEYWSVRIILPTKEFKLVVIFPKDRVYNNYCGYQRITSHEKVADIQPVEAILEGRPALVWTVKNPKLKDVYKLVWNW